MTRPLQHLRRRRVIVVLIVVALLVIAVPLIGAVTADPSVRTSSSFVAGTPEAGKPVRFDTILYLPERTPAPAVLLAHGFGGTKHDVDAQAKRLARHGFVVLAYTARGFGQSGGRIHLDSPDYEVKDASLLLDHLQTLPQVRKDALAVAGSSYGGGLALLLAGTDTRIKAVAVDVTWNDLGHALFPNAASGDEPGVFKKLWTGYLFGGGLPDAGNLLGQLAGGAVNSADGAPGTAPDPACGRFAADICAAYQRAAETGTADPGLVKLLQASSPASVIHSIRAPTLLTQGEQDSLFPLSEADANAKGLAETGTPVQVIWRAGGHDGSGSAGGADVTGAMITWFDDAFAGRTPDTTFKIDSGTRFSSDGDVRVRGTLDVPRYPGIDGSAPDAALLPLNGPAQRIAAPAGGNPAAITTLPGIGGVLNQLGQVGGASLSLLSAIPGQVAVFATDPLAANSQIAGAATAGLTVTSSTSDAVLFVGLQDFAPQGGRVLINNLVNPLRLTGLTPGRPTNVEVRLPSVAINAAKGHRLVVTVSTTDFAYQLPADPRTYTVAARGELVLPTVHGQERKQGTPVIWLIAGIVVAVAVGLGVWLTLRRRRRVLHAAPGLVDVPVVITDLVKSYGDGYRAVDGVSFRVERGQVVGLLGPNGAGKTTILRMLVGLITPTAGTMHVFGQPIAPGAPVLARLGSFIEGPGFLPHLTGRQNLELFWAATGRDPARAEFDTALEIAGLGASLERKVRAYSQGMRQRLGIAQAMLGLPELLVLDEPTNGLDPPQIAEMREVLRSYAETGRTVIVSSHLLAEVEQTCTDVVVMHKGRLVAAGSVAEIAGAGAQQLVVGDPDEAVRVLAAAGITAQTVPARRALEDVFLDLVGEERV